MHKTVDKKYGTTNIQMGLPQTRGLKQQRNNSKEATYAMGESICKPCV
jgi:hypothetical protein